jgi:hypothetical protein
MHIVITLAAVLALLLLLESLAPSFDVSATEPATAEPSGQAAPEQLAHDRAH